MSSAVVTVIVPVYNVEDFIARCIDSILNQSYQKLEVVLIDDGSLDRSGTICDEYADQDDRVRVFHQSNQGAAAAMNQGVDLARGDFLMFVGADDWVHPELVSYLLRQSQNFRADIAMARFVWTPSDGVTSPRTEHESRLSSGMSALERFCGADSSQMVSPCVKLFPAHLFGDIRFPNGRFHEDEFTTYKVFLRAQTVVISTRELYYYFSRPGSATRREREVRRLRDRVLALEERASIFRSLNLIHAADCTLWEVFRVHRQVGRKVQVTGRREEVRRWRKDLRDSARRVRGSSLPIGNKFVATLYSLAPRLSDVAVALMRSDSAH